VNRASVLHLIQKMHGKLQADWVCKEAWLAKTPAASKRLDDPLRDVCGRPSSERIWTPGSTFFTRARQALQVLGETPAVALITSTDASKPYFSARKQVMAAAIDSGCRPPISPLSMSCLATDSAEDTRACGYVKATQCCWTKFTHCSAPDWVLAAWCFGSSEVIMGHLAYGS